jgi:type III secretion protein J
VVIRRSSTRALVVAAALAGGCGGVELEHGLDEGQANRVAAVLDRAGVPVEKVAAPGASTAGAGGAYTIVVPRADLARAVALLEAHDLPRRGQRGLGEAFAEPALLPSAVEERARLAAALAADLERTLGGLPDVLSARVHLALPDADPLGIAPARTVPTASVVIRAAKPLATSEDQLRALVAGAVSGLEPRAVQLVVAVAPAAADGAAATTGPALARVGPFQVAERSRRPLVIAMVIALALIVVLGAALAGVALRLLGRRRTGARTGDALTPATR